MGTGSKVVSVILRLGQLISAINVTALLGRFFCLINSGNGLISGRLIYAEVISALAIIFSIVLIFPARYSFYAFPLDILFFICSIVAFALLVNLNGSCSSYWYYNYWGFYWGGFWTYPRVDPGVVGNAGCATWRTILAFLFIGAMAWLLSAILGAYVSVELRENRRTIGTTPTTDKLTRKKNTGWQAQTDSESHHHQTTAPTP